MLLALTSCAEIVGGRNVTEKLAQFYADELRSVDFELIKKAINSYTNRGRFPTVDDIRMFAGQRANFDNKAPDGTKTHEQKVKDENKHLPYASTMPVGVSFAVELWSHRDNCSEQEAVEDIKEWLKNMERGYIFRDHLYTPEIKPKLVTVHDSIAQGNKTIEQPRQRWKAVVIVYRLEPEKLPLIALPPTDEF